MFWEFLKEFGFNTYELKALQGLLRLGRATPSQISEAENIPSSKIYSALDRLETAGLIIKFGEENSYQLAEQHQITTILNTLQKQKTEEFTDSLGNLSKYLSHQSQAEGKSAYSLLQEEKLIQSKLVWPSLEAPNDISIYWNVFSSRDLALIAEFIQKWIAAKREYSDRILIHAAIKPELEIPPTRKIQVRFIQEYKGNSLVLWGQKQVGMIITSPAQTNKFAIDIADKQLSQSYADEFDKWWFEGSPMYQSYNA